MRLLHTSDWHLGRTLHGVNLHEAQSAVLERICELVEDPPDGIPVDAVLVAGDVYDRGVPPVESVQLFEWTLSRLSAVTTVVITSGNHDSAIRLGYGAGLFRDSIRMVTDLGQLDLPVLLEGSDGVRAAVYGIPYLDPDHARVALAGGGEPLPRSHQAVVGAACDRIRADLADRPGVRSVVLAHAFVAGCRAERLRALDHGRRRRPGGRHGLPRHRLRRARAPPRPAGSGVGGRVGRALLRFPAALLLLRAGARRRSCSSSTSTPQVPRA